MLGLGTSSAVSTNAAVTSSIVSTGHPLQSVTYATSSAFHPATVFLSHQLVPNYLVFSYMYMFTINLCCFGFHCNVSLLTFCCSLRPLRITWIRFVLKRWQNLLQLWRWNPSPNFLVIYLLKYFLGSLWFMSVSFFILFQSTLSGKKQALISLSDKKDLALLGVGLQELGWGVLMVLSY